MTGGTAPYTSAWTFGDGTSSTSSAPSHPYTNSGTFTVDLTVTDADHRSVNTTLDVVVSSSSSSGFSLTSGVGLYALLAIIVIVVVVVAVVFVARRKKSPPAGAAPWNAPPPVGAAGGAPPPDCPTAPRPRRPPTRSLTAGRLR